MKFTTILTEDEFKKRCIEKKVPFLKSLWNQYMELMWRRTEEEIIEWKKQEALDRKQSGLV